MLFRAAVVGWLVVPLAAFFVLFSTGAAAAPDCRIESTSQMTNNSAVVHNHSAAPHSHSHQLTNSAALNIQETLFASGSLLNNEICFIVGFIVLLLLRYSHLTRSIFTVRRSPRPRYLQHLSLPENLGFLQLTHLKLGIIRI